MKRKKMLTRKCSALLAAGTGAAVCLGSGHFSGTAEAAISTGRFRDSNAGGTATGTASWQDGPTFTAQAFNNGALTWLVTTNLGSLFFHPVNAGPTQMQIEGPGGGNHPVNPGVSITSGLAWQSTIFMGSGTNFNDGGNPKYFMVRFTTNGGANWNYGWWRMRFYSIANVLVKDWGFENNVDTTLLTLSDTLVTRKLSLVDGKAKLHWTNKNEDGVSRYEVQKRDAAGEWREVDSDTPGDGRYTAKVAGEGEYRLVVEKVDGTTAAVDF